MSVQSDPSLNCILEYLERVQRSIWCMQIAWEWRGFVNQGRSDALQLHHWAKCLKDLAGNVKLADEGDYRYAKYNKKVHSRFVHSLKVPICEDCKVSVYRIGEGAHECFQTPCNN